MSTPISTITSKWQVTIPKEVRKELRLKIGQRIVWKIEGDKIVGLRVPCLSELEGCFNASTSAPSGKDAYPREFAKAAFARHERLSGFKMGGVL